MHYNSDELKQWSGKGLIYLATPYNHTSRYIRQKRFEAACTVASVLMEKGIHLFCPIAHTHPIAEKGNLPKGWEYWREFDRKLLSRCTELWIVKIDRWDKSEGIRAEIEIAHELCLPVLRLEF